MDLQLTDKLIAVGGATSGLGRGVAEALLAEGARVIGLARNADRLKEMQDRLGEHFIPYAGDLTDEEFVTQLGTHLNEQHIYGVCLNAGGPPSAAIEELELDDWDAAYRGTLRWKIQLLDAILPGMLDRAAGRVVLVESISIKQPIDNLGLSNVFRAGVAAYVKTLVNERGGRGTTINILAPGYHETPRITEVLNRSAEIQGLPEEEIRRLFLAQVPTGTLGRPADFGTLAAWLFSPHASYVTGQTICVDGGRVQGAWG